MAHHGHLVQSRLPIKHHKVVVLHVTFNLYSQCSICNFFLALHSNYSYNHQHHQFIIIIGKYHSGVQPFS